MLYLQKLTAISIGIFFSLFFLLGQAFADITISGTVSLPDSVSPYGSNQSISLLIYHDWNGSYFQASTNCQSIELIAGENSVDFNCTVANLNGLIAIEANASNLDGIYYDNFYHHLGTVWRSEDAEQLDSSINHSDKDIILLPSITLEGELQTPEGITFTTEKHFSIFCRYWEDPWWQWGPNKYYTFPANITSTSYSISIPAIIGNFKLQYRFWDPLENGLVSDGYYSASETEFNIDDAQILSSLDGNQNNMDMELLQGLPVVGGISLPTGETNSDGMQVQIRAMPVNDWNEVGSVDVDIPAGETFAPYTMYVPPGNNIEISYTNVRSADRAYVADGYYTGTSTSFRWYDATDFPPDSPPPIVDLTLIPGYTVSGQVSLPSGEASSEIQCYVDVEFLAPGNVWTTSLNTYVVIDSGTSSTDYSVTVPTDATNISVYYNSWGLLDYYYLGYYSDGETTWDYTKRTLFPGGSNLPNISLTLVPSVTISGNLALAEGLTANEDIDASLALYLFTPITQEWNGFGWGWVTINAGANSAPYSLQIPVDLGDAYLAYSLWDESNEYISNGYYNSVTTTSNIDIATPISSSTDQSGLNMTLVRYNSITGQIYLTDNELASKDIWIGLGALTQPDGDYHTTNIGLWSYHTTDRIFSNYVRIHEGENSVDYTVNIAEDVGDVSIEYSLSSSDSEYVKHGFYDYNATNNVTGFFTDADLITAVSDHPGTDMTMLHGFLVEGTIKLAEPAVKGEIVEIGFRPIASGVDQFYDTTIFIPWQATSVDYSYRALCDHDAVVGMKTGEKNGFFPQLYFKTPTETVNDLAQATVIRSSDLPLNLDFYLSSWLGDINLDSNVDLADSILALQTISGTTGITAFKEGDATGDGRIGVEDAVQVMKIEAGWLTPASCNDNSDCDSSELCKKVSCADTSGTCITIPESGDCEWWSQSDPVCGCDGLTYITACEAAIEGTNVDHIGSCFN